MLDKSQYLIVGGDSLVGGEVFNCFKKHGHNVITTTRRKNTVTEDRILFDFEDESTYQVPVSVQHAFIIAAATDYNRCEVDPLAYEINVVLIPRAIKSLLEQGVFVTYISTNSVFGGEQPWPNEDAPHQPGIAYARQKSESEDAVISHARDLGKEDQFNIVRLTKILDATTAPLPQWIESWEKGEIVTPFTDLIFAPMSRQFVSNALMKIGQKRISGNFHLSGAENVSYVRLSKAIAEKKGCSCELIEATTSIEKNVHIAFKPTYSGLGMARTTEIFGLEAQPLENVINDIY